jgi:hypothetical protein
MKTLLRMCMLAMLCVASRPPFIQAQAADAASESGSYDIHDEITVQGTASAVFAKAPKGTLNGAHLFVSTSSGSMDVSLGVYGLAGKDALRIQLGQEVEITGVLRTLRGAQVLIARTVTVGDQIYPIRNEHGIALPPQAREHARALAQTGGKL